LAGRVLVDGVDVRDLNLKWLRSQIGLVGQEPTLFGTTIKNNVMHGLVNTRWENSSEDEKFALVKEACVKANAEGFISKLPLGYDTMVGERGFLLSGGQKQRIAIARAIVSDPRILLLDEATSALDTQSEGVVQDALDRAAAGRTTITIAHRLSTIRDADHIYVMGAGEVLEHGTHNELLAKHDGAYAKLVQAQKLREQVQQEADAESAKAPVTSDKIQKAAATEVPLGRSNSTRSVASELAEKKAADLAANNVKDVSLYELFRRMAAINQSAWRMYIWGGIAAILTGAVYPCFGIIFG
jgi:ATP-binding cassette subfamily B (MDR/TAP) protein 1